MCMAATVNHHTVLVTPTFTRTVSAERNSGAGCCWWQVSRDVPVTMSFNIVPSTCVMLAGFMGIGAVPYGVRRLIDGEVRVAVAAGVAMFPTIRWRPPAPLPWLCRSRCLALCFYRSVAHSTMCRCITLVCFCSGRCGAATSNSAVTGGSGTGMPCKRPVRLRSRTCLIPFTLRCRSGLAGEAVISVDSVAATKTSKLCHELNA